MKPVRLHPECLQCLVGKKMPAFFHNEPFEKQIEYMQRLLKMLSEAPATMAAPVLVSDIAALRKEMFGYEQNFEAVKQQYNQLMLGREEELYTKIEQAEDPLLAAVQYSLIGNYIDFGAQNTVEESKLDELLSKAEETHVDEANYASFRKDVLSSRKTVFLTDNCGEVVLDKLLLRIMMQMNPSAEYTVIVRGKDVLNDATMQDAEQIGLTKMLRVIGNGNGIAGTWLDAVSQEALAAIDEADVIVAKGQANFETLNQCRRNVYYLFLCKCDMFASRFNVPRFTGMLLRDQDLCKD